MSHSAPASPHRHDPPLTLGEGNTPLIRSRFIGPQAGLEQLHFKLESVNPTGSYKDRFAVAAINAMRRAGQTRVIASSSGNAGAALAAYCAAAGLDCEIAVVELAPASKLKQMQAYGARLTRIDGFGTDPDITERTMDYLRQLGNRPDSALQITAYRFCPLGMAGVETISHELIARAASFSRPIEHVFVCAGGGGLGLAVARGFESAVRAGTIAQSPQIHCVQPAGNDTIAGPLRRGEPTARACQSTTAISGLQVANVIDGNELLAACRATGGSGFLVTDERVLELQRTLALREGIFCEPAAAVGLAGALQAAQEGSLNRDAPVVCLITGSGFKDQASLDRMVAEQACPLRTLDQFQAQNGS